MKVKVTKDHYEDIRNAEKTTGSKAKNLMIAVPDCVNGVHGVYQVKRCYKTLNGYFADMKLLEKANSSHDAEIKTLLFMKKLQNENKNSLLH